MGGKPIQTEPYRVGATAWEAENEQVDSILCTKFIEPSQTQWALPIVVIQKKNRTLRICDAYRPLNAVTTTVMCSSPLIDACIYSLGEAEIFYTVHLNSGLWQIQDHTCNREKRALTSYQGFYLLPRTSFGLVNATATFQWVMTRIMSTIKWQYDLL